MLLVWQQKGGHRVTCQQPAVCDTGRQCLCIKLLFTRMQRSGGRHEQSLRGGLVAKASR
jgi:hypothetical protein